MSTTISSSMATSWSNALFSKLDTNKQGYIDKTALQQAFAADGSATQDSTDAADALFQQLDGDGNGQVTQSEMSSVISKLADELNAQFDQGRMARAGGPPHGAPPPGPPPGEDGVDAAAQDEGLSKDDLTAMLENADAAGGRTPPGLDKLVDNFDDADSDGDGKLTRAEGKSYLKANRNEESAADGGSASALAKALQLLKAYVDERDGSAGAATASATVATSA
ncbi:EF-hand domain-containing protein [Massilia sp. 9I]|uniref:EF-hand domain-containing protein n=1 Tax=Massilia sp. 9I TaxID=2653152 RepID=UPI0012F45DF5|nr:EF-hand domain-containing protein [Massilia sp. 9I]VXC57934.1 putative EF-hand domain-containing protein [Massilia sp. 9I]